MEINLFVYAPPFFVLLIVIEFIVSRINKQTIYFLNDFVNNISSGIVEQSCTLPLQGLLIYSYQYLYTHHALFVIKPTSPFSWIFLWLGVDFFYYWFHRASHRNTFLWTAHSVHHQSEQYNLSVALRQGVFQTMFSWVVYLPLAVLGFPTWMFAIVAASNTLYQFWIHTKLIDRLGWFEIIFNTPSHHRVHHAINQQYIDKNYAGSLIIWDKLFGTFTPESSPITYGVTEPLDSWNPFYANVKVIYDTCKHSKNLSIWQRLIAFLKPPEWVSKQELKALSLAAQKKENSSQEHNNSSSSHNFSEFAKLSPRKMHLDLPSYYILVNIGIAMVIFNIYLLAFSIYSMLGWLLGAFILSTLYIIGVVLEQGPQLRSTINVEFWRILLLMFILQLFTQSYIIAFTGVALFFCFNYLLFYISINHHKQEKVF